MKRKIFSKLLMGAFLFASVSAFVSCKDYDDDINANKADIKAVQEQLSTLTSNLNSLQTQLQNQKTALEQELSTAKSQLETQIASAKAELNAAIEKKADQSTVDALATRVSNLETNLAALKAAYDAKFEAINSALASLQTLIEKKADITYVDNAIAILNSAINGKVAKDEFSEVKNLVNNLNSDLATLAVLVDTKASQKDVDAKADQKDIDNAVEKINEKIAALQEAMKITVPQSEIVTIQKAIDDFKAQLNALTQAVAGKAEQSAVDQLNAFYKELKENVNESFAKLQAQVDALVTPAMLEKAIQTLKDEMEAKGAEETKALQEAIAALDEKLGTNIADLKTYVDDQIAATNATVEANKKAAEKDLTDAVNTINTALGTKASVDDLDEAKAEYRAAIKILTEDIATKWAAVTGDLETVNETLEKIQDALKLKASQASVDELEGNFNEFVKLQNFENGKLDKRLIACEALIEQVAAINTFLGDITEGTLAGKLADLQKLMSDDAAAKVKAEADAREEAIKIVNKTIADLQEDLNDQIAKANAAREALYEKLYGTAEDATAGDITKLQNDFKAIDEEFTTIQNDFTDLDGKVQDIDEKLDNLKVFVVRMLTSVTLIPELYVGGIEAIAFESVQYLEVEQCNSNGVHGNVDHTGNTQVAQEPLSATQSSFKVFGWTHIKNNTWRYVGNEEATAQYRVSPAHLDENTFIVDQIEVVANRALTRATGLCKSPVEVIKNRTTYDKATGVVRIYLKKTDDFQGKDLNAEGLAANEIYTVSLRVPRAENYVPTDADGNKIAEFVYSEFSRLDEVKIRPYIAELFVDPTGNYQWRYAPGYHNTYYSNQFTNDAINGLAPYGDRAGWGPLHAKANQSGAWTVNTATQHFLDSATVFRSAVDADEYVKAQILWSRDGDNEFCLNDVVTGSYDSSVGRTVGEKLDPNGKHTQITADDLKKFGLAFRFAIPNVYYGSVALQQVDHITNQNLFAAVRYDANTGKTYIRSTYAVANAAGQGTSSALKVDARNAASVGKEPIVRIELRDTVNNRLVDQRYMKIKWIEDIIPAVKLDDKVDSKVLNCTSMKSEYTWSEFINKVYAVAQNQGMSQSTFEGIYPWNKITISFPNASRPDGTTGAGGFDAAVYNAAAPNYTALKPVFASTTNENGDALIGSWTLTPDDVRRIFRGSASDSRTFVARVTFNSISKTEHPDLYFDWKFTITLPALPAINGFYENYWYTNDYSAHYVLPVQYTPGFGVYAKLTGNEISYAAATATAAGVETADGYVPGYNPANNQNDGQSKYCVFDNNLMNAFTYDVDGNAKPRFVVKNIYNGCQSWDIQFRQIQQETGYASGWYNTGYKNADWNSLTFTGLHDQFREIEPDTTTGTPYATFPAYHLYKATTQATQTAATRAAQIVWLQGHKSWDADKKYKSANLVADHINWNAQTPNRSIEALLNPLQDENESDGWTPLKTNAKQIRMAIWGTINKWNHVPVWYYNIALVAPLRVNAELKGVFEDGHVSGTAVPYDQALSMTDFRGYVVADVADGTYPIINNKDNQEVERKSYTKSLHTYYEVGQPAWQTDKVLYGFKQSNGSVVADPDAKVINNGAQVQGGMTAAKIYQLTNGNIDLSITDDAAAKKLRFKNNGGSNVETTVSVFIPVTVRYGFGEITRYVTVKLYKKGTSGQPLVY